MLRILLGLLCIVSVATSSHAEEVVRLTNGEWLPYQSERLANFGIASHIVTRAFELEGVKVEYSFMPWKRAFDTARSGSADGTLVWRRSPEREREFWYSAPVFEGQTVFFHHRDQPFQWQTVNDLKGKRMGATLGYQYLPLEPPEKAGIIQLQRVANDELNLRKLLWQRIDLFPSDLEVGYAILREKFSEEERAQIQHHPQPLEVVSYYLLLNRSKPAHQHLIEGFNRGLAKLKESGEYAKMFETLRQGGY